MAPVLFMASLVAWVLLGSAWAKIREPGVFRQILRQYGASARFARRGTRAVPLAELAVAACLLSLQASWIRVALFGACAFFVAASGLVVFRAMRGDTRFRCGCGGDLSQPHHAGWMLARNAALFGMCVTAMLLGLEARYSLPDAVPAYLMSATLLATIKLSHAARMAHGAINEWTAAG